MLSPSSVAGLLAAFLLRKLLILLIGTSPRISHYHRFGLTRTVRRGPLRFPLFTRTSPRPRCKTRNSTNSLPSSTPFAQGAPADVHSRSVHCLPDLTPR